ncbi:MAG: hypothetical protein DRJ51_09245 [Thermoprotei archaeon]|nr:MAG: hypothetical protein DRJ51_09245 [Thermoprotei archaeon]
MLVNKHTEDESPIHEKMVDFIKESYRKNALSGIKVVENEFEIDGYRPDLYYVRKFLAGEEHRLVIECLTTFSIARDPDIVERKIENYLKIADEVVIALQKNTPIHPNIQGSSYYIYRINVGGPDFVIHVREWAEGNDGIGLLLSTPKVYPLVLPPLEDFRLPSKGGYGFDYQVDFLHIRVGGYGLGDMPTLVDHISRKEAEMGSKDVILGTKYPEIYKPFEGIVLEIWGKFMGTDLEIYWSLSTGYACCEIYEKPSRDAKQILKEIFRVFLKSVGYESERMTIAVTP